VHDCDRGGLGEIILNVFTEEEILAAGGDRSQTMGEDNR
jgi:hypothetical protein